MRGRFRANVLEERSAPLRGGSAEGFPHIDTRRREAGTPVQVLSDVIIRGDPQPDFAVTCLGIHLLQSCQGGFGVALSAMGWKNVEVADENAGAVFIRLAPEIAERGGAVFANDA